MSSQLPTGAPEVVLYTGPGCGYCMAARRLLRARGTEPREVDVGRSPEGRAELLRRTGRSTLPQIVIDGKPIGGFRELAALDRAGGLGAGAAPAPPSLGQWLRARCVPCTIIPAILVAALAASLALDLVG